MLPTLPSDDEKRRVWDHYRSGRPSRVPLTFYTNPRVVLDNSAWNPQGITFEQCYHDPKAHLTMLLQHELFRRRVIHRHSDGPTALPDVWEVYQFEYNVYEAAQFGAPVRFPTGQVPVTEPPFEDDADKLAIFEQDITQPLATPYWSSRLAFWRELDKVVSQTRFEGRPVRLHPLAAMGTDGPVTGACNLRGTGFMLDLAEDPDYADRLLTFLGDAVIHRRKAFANHWGDRTPVCPPGLADDSCALISLDMYRRQVLPHHRRLYEAMGEGSRSMHMCGHASHLFTTLHDELHVTSFDTGFPIDHGRLRRDLGPDVEILGGPEVDLLLHGTPPAVFDRTRVILTSGVTEGGRFILREGNNLPPNVPEPSLAATYEACLTHGRFDRPDSLAKKG